MLEDNLTNYYNKFNEDKRLSTKHGQFEFLTTTKFMEDVLKKLENPQILDVGAGTGKYSLYLETNGYDVTAVELVKHNLKMIEAKSSKIKTYLGNALNLEMLKNKQYDLILLFGPIYHLSKNDKIKAIKEASKHLKKNGYLMIVYCLNDFAVLKHGFLNQNIKEEQNNLDDNFIIKDNPNNLYFFDTLNDINKYNKICNLKRVTIFSQEGPIEYFRPNLNKMDTEEFNLLLKFHLSRAQNYEYLGLSRHVVDIVQKREN